MARITHFEIPASDPERSMAFYTTVFGWTFQRWGTEDYWIAATGPENESGINGAILLRRAPDMPVVNTLVVEDMDAAIERVEQNGGQIVVPKVTIPGMGYQCYFKDPDGIIHGMMMYDAQAGAS
ncbi:MAG: VOC family protein [Chitinophagales bacterium]